MFELPAARLDTRALAAQLRALKADAPLSYAAPNPAAGGRIDRFEAPRTVEALAAARARQPQARLLAGSTDIGLWVNKQFKDIGDVLYLGDVAELRGIDALADGTLCIGAGAPLQDAWAAIAQRWPTLAEVGLRFAGPPVRHAGTLGGNLANGSPIGDGAPVLMALDARLLLRQGDRTREITLDDFYLDYMKNRLEAGEFVQAIHIPPPPPSRQVRAYKISKRFDCDISAVCAGLALGLDDGIVTEARFAFGGMAATVRRAAAAEAAVTDRPWTEATLQAAMAALDTDFTPLTDLRASADYRRRVARALLRRLWLETRTDRPVPVSALNVRAVELTA
jgi:xanthine dehydrogenase small subunit